jgi:ribose-phosphate pyrophosphokinase
MKDLVIAAGNVGSTANVVEVECKQFVFPGGEVGIKIDTDNHRFVADFQSLGGSVYSRIKSSEDFMKLVMVRDALYRICNHAQVELFLAYVPYGRQDRICDGGEAFSLKAFAGILNSLSFKRVYTFDPHSSVTEALIQRVKVVDLKTIFRGSRELYQRAFTGVTLVSPDAGANKKVSDLAASLGHPEFIRADKLRDLTNGKIKEMIVYADDLEKKDIMIVDDICDGGATFIALAQELKKKNAGRVILYVTHGIFSKGVQVLLENGIDEIWTTDSYQDFPEDFVKTYGLSVVELSKHNSILSA